MILTTMAFECFYSKFSQKSDVWAFGVIMWEIFTLAKEQPYNEMSDKQVVEDALKGKNHQILSKPDMCPLEVYKIMLECWSHDSEQWWHLRSSFMQLLTSIYFWTGTVSQIPYLKKRSQILHIRTGTIVTNTMIFQILQMSNKEMTSTLCQTPPAHIQLRLTVKQCIASQSSLHSSQIQWKLSVIVRIWGLMPPFTASWLKCQRVKKCF